MRVYKLYLLTYLFKIYEHFSIANGQPREAALCQLYQHTFLPYKKQSFAFYRRQHSPSAHDRQHASRSLHWHGLPTTSAYPKTTSSIPCSLFRYVWSLCPSFRRHASVFCVLKFAFVFLLFCSCVNTDFQLLLSCNRAYTHVCCMLFTMNERMNELYLSVLAYRECRPRSISLCSPRQVQWDQNQHLMA